MRLTLALSLFLLLTGCARRDAQPLSPTPIDLAEAAFLDLQAGWRLQVVVPILKSGGYRLPSLQLNGQNAGSLKVGPDFVGYENDYYAVVKNGGGVRTEFRFAEVVKDGNTTPQSLPLVSLFNLPANMRYVRLIFLVRVSNADHDMAIAAAADPKALAAITRRVQANPDAGCASGVDSFCAWVPAGIAVRPQKRAIVNGKKDWVPAR